MLPKPRWSLRCARPARINLMSISLDAYEFTEIDAQTKMAVTLRHARVDFNATDAPNQDGVTFHARQA